jgi:hypothetical protein
VDVRIGVTQSPREIEVELADNTGADELVAQIDAAVSKGTVMLWLTDKLAYVELDSGAETRRVGFGAAV